MIKSDANNNKGELDTVKEDSESKTNDDEPNSFNFDVFSLKTLLPPMIPPKGMFIFVKLITIIKVLPGTYFDLSLTFAVSPDNFVIQPHNQGGRENS